MQCRIKENSQNWPGCSADQGNLRWSAAAAADELFEEHEQTRKQKCESAKNPAGYVYCGLSRGSKMRSGSSGLGYFTVQGFNRASQLLAADVFFTSYTKAMGFFALPEEPES